MDDLLGFHESEPHNPKIAHVFFLAGLIERWGRGVQRIFSACKIDGVESPLYRMVGNSLQIVFTAPADRVMRIGVQQSDPGDIATHVSADDGSGTVLARLGATWRDLARRTRILVIALRRRGTRFPQGTGAFSGSSRLTAQLGRPTCRIAWESHCEPRRGR